MAEEPAAISQTSQLESRLERVEQEDDSQVAQGAAEQARRALDRASRPDQDPASAARAREVAHAAVVLAERRLDRRQTQEGLLLAQQRLIETRERAAAQRRVLEALLRERAALARERESK